MRVCTCVCAPVALGAGAFSSSPRTSNETMWRLKSAGRATDKDRRTSHASDSDEHRNEKLEQGKINMRAFDETMKENISFFFCQFADEKSTLSGRRDLAVASYASHITKDPCAA